MGFRVWNVASLFWGLNGADAWRRSGLTLTLCTRKCAPRVPLAWRLIDVLTLCIALSCTAGALAQAAGDTVVVGPAGQSASTEGGSEGEPVTRQGRDTEPPAAEAAMQRRFNELKGELLEERSKSIDRWLVVIGLVLTFFGIVVAIAGLWAFGRFRNIEADARESAEAAGTHAEAARQLVGEIAQHKSESEQQLELIHRVTAEVAQDEPQQASMAAEAVQEDPGASPIDKAVGRAIGLQASGHTDDAIELWRCIARIAKEANDHKLNARAHYSIAFLSMDGDPEDAITEFDRAIELDPRNLKAYGNRGVSKAGLGRYEDAIADYDWVIELDPGNAKGYHNRGNAKHALGRYEDAIADFDKALDLDSSRGLSYVSRGNAKHALGRHEDAIADFDKALGLDPGYLNAYGNRGLLKAGLGRHEDAIADFDRVIQLDPGDAKGYHNRGDAKSALGRETEAEVDFEAARRAREHS